MGEYAEWAAYEEFERYNQDLTMEEPTLEDIRDLEFDAGLTVDVRFKKGVSIIAQTKYAVLAIFRGWPLWFPKKFIGYDETCITHIAP
jgi:hypothetical protein